MYLKANVFFDAVSPIIRIVSSLADGADQLASEVAVDQDCEIEAIIPFDIESYVQGFPGVEWHSRFQRIVTSDCCKAVLRLDGNSDSMADISYETAGDLLVKNVDILLAFWNGAPARGPGGTETVISAAVQANVPVIWIPIDGTEWKALRISSQAGYDRIIEAFNSDDMLNILSAAICPSDELTKNLRTYFANKRPFVNVEGIWENFLNFTSGGKIPSREISSPWVCEWPPLSARSGDWDDQAITARLPASLCRGINLGVRPFFEWADGLAANFSAVYRASYLAVYLLSFFAVLLAGLGWALSEIDELYFERSMLGCVEVFMIAAILLLTSISASKNWHVRALEYRLLAEWLRQYRLHFAVCAITSRPAQSPHLSRYVAPGTSWMAWLSSAVERAAGVPDVAYDMRTLRAINTWIFDSHLVSQSAYHRDIVTVIEAAEHNLRNLSRKLFLLAFLFAIGHLVIHNVWFSFACVVLPALASTLSAIRSHSQFESVTRRSTGMSEHLQLLADDCKKIPLRKNSLDSRNLRVMVSRSSRAMNDEAVGWVTSFADHPVEIP